MDKGSCSGTTTSQSQWLCRRNLRADTKTIREGQDMRQRYSINLAIGNMQFFRSRREKGDRSVRRSKNNPGSILLKRKFHKIHPTKRIQPPRFKSNLSRKLRAASIIYQNMETQINYAV
ncbi:hypothetical protein PHMEG_00025994 [Phytophthora megakarya]|uniref:Uncharacterized protein n=1 Tax=Phytophthora megakarya TaxID=4795 RepID=A0A225VAA6_9STRA|nr:hypothetical protein PHMEG_00025994 [Phytophthora megakarya]